MYITRTTVYKDQSRTIKHRMKEIIILVLLSVVTTYSKEAVDCEEIKLQMKELKESRALTEDEEIQSKDVYIQNLEKKLENHEVTILEMKGDMLKTQELVNHNNAVIKKLDRDMSFLKDPPFTFFCASAGVTATGGVNLVDKTITYNNLLYSSTNVDGADLDTSTGFFTAGWGGSYTVTWSLYAGVDAGENAILVYLRRNAEIIEESRHYSMYVGDNGYIEDQGGRTLVLRLDRGDTLDLFCQDCSSYVHYITFCISQSNFDIE